jgi:hypothetical protein
MSTHTPSTPTPTTPSADTPPNVTATVTATVGYKYSTNNVLTLKGGAAQQTTHPGNLYYYGLCEEYYPKYQACLQENDNDENEIQRKRSVEKVCNAVVEKVQQNGGGIFRNYKGRPMQHKQAVEKTRDRFRQIARPKRVAPTSVSQNDVVWVVGGTNHLFEGNTKCRELIDSYVTKYWPNVYTTSTTDTRVEDEDEDDPPSPKRSIPQYQLDIIEEIVDTIHKTGGRFLGYSLRPLSSAAVKEKIHKRFRDLKRMHLRNTTTTTTTTTTTKRTKFESKGCTSKRNTIHVKGGSRDYVQYNTESQDDVNDNSDEYTTVQANAVRIQRREENEETKRQAKEREERRKKRSRRQQQEEEEEEGNEGKDDKASTNDEEAAANANNSSTTATTRPKRKRKRKRPTFNSEFDDVDPTTDPTTMSEYERLRHEKMKRNRQRLIDLGLLRHSREK